MNQCGKHLKQDFRNAHIYHVMQKQTKKEKKKEKRKNHICIDTLLSMGQYVVVFLIFIKVKKL